LEAIVTYYISTKEGHSKDAHARLCLSRKGLIIIVAISITKSNNSKKGHSQRQHIA
jgi:hypothetical protein